MTVNSVVGYSGSVSGCTGVRRWRYNSTCKEVDVTSMSSAGVRQYKAGITDGEFEIEVNSKPPWAAGTIVVATLSTGSTGGSADSYAGSLLVTAVNCETPYDDQVIWRITGKASNGG